jgi:nitrate/nitrite transporter NarK
VDLLLPSKPRTTGQGRVVVRRIAILMVFEAATLAVASALHLPNRAGIAEGIIGAGLLGGTLAMFRFPARSRTIGIVLNTFATIGFLNGLTMTARDGDAPAIAYHLLVLPLLIASLVILVRTRDDTPDEPGD